MYPSPRPAPPNGPSTCPRCHAEVIWCVTAHQKAQMIDPGRNPDGNQAVHQDRTGRWRVRQLSNERPTPEGSESLHMPHVATCPIPATRPPRPVGGRDRRGVRPSPWRPR